MKTVQWRQYNILCVSVRQMSAVLTVSYRRSRTFRYCEQSGGKIGIAAHYSYTLVWTAVSSKLSQVLHTSARQCSDAWRCCRHGAQPCCPILSSTTFTLLFTLFATAPPALSLYCPFSFTCFVIACAAVLCWLLLSGHMILAVHSFFCGSVVWSLVADFVSGRSCLCTDSSTVTLGCTLQRPITSPPQVQQ